MIMSFGNCELCKSRTLCHDIPSSQLPKPETITAYVVYDNNGITPFSVYSSKEKMESDMEQSIGNSGKSYQFKTVEFNKVDFDNLEKK